MSAIAKCRVLDLGFDAGSVHYSPCGSAGHEDMSRTTSDWLVSRRQKHVVSSSPVAPGLDLKRVL